jgi:hypothetical protein
MVGDIRKSGRNGDKWGGGGVKCNLGKRGKRKSVKN